MNGAKKLWAAATLQPYQRRVRKWVEACFGHRIAEDRTERTHRFLEEALELSQATGCTRADAHALVDYTYGRPVGEPGQEVGGVMVTLAGLCAALGIEMDAEAERELARVWTKVEAIRAKQAAKPKFGPLPEAPAVTWYGMAWDFQHHHHGARCKGKTDGGMYPWDREHALEMVEQMNRIYGPDSHWIIPA